MLFFPRIFRTNPFQVLCLIGVVSWVALCDSFFIPTITGFFGFGKPDLFQYDVVAISQFPAFSVILRNIVINGKLILVESFQLFSPYDYHTMEGKLLSTLPLLLKNNNMPTHVPKDLYWLPIEMGAVQQYKIPTFRSFVKDYEYQCPLPFPVR